MFDLRLAKQLSDDDLREYETQRREALDLEQRRLTALLRTQQRNPSWSFFNEDIGEDTGIDTLIEIWEAGVDELESDIETITGELERRRVAKEQKADYDRRVGIGAAPPGSAEAAAAAAPTREKISQPRMF
jgi:hypothetical protein